ncbi:MAG: DUF4198 domain-containing protein [Chloroflexi bacterium]|nr:DUF4198 domain-containing protein [Chloroflexota bacterium]
MLGPPFILPSANTLESRGNDMRIFTRVLPLALAATLFVLASACSSGGTTKTTSDQADGQSSDLVSMDPLDVLSASAESFQDEVQSLEVDLQFVINVGGLPGRWDEPLGLPVEIVPLDKPYANWVGGVFRAVILADGNPVPHAEIEIEYLNHEPQIDQLRFDPEGKVTAPQGSFITLSIRANALGEVTIGLPKAGWWGICALDLDDGLEYNGKELSLDAVLWIHATEMMK